MTASSSAQRCAVIFGATGAVGSHCLDALLASPRYGNVLSIGRRRTGVTHAKLTEITAELDQLPTIQPSAMGRSTTPSAALAPPLLPPDHRTPSDASIAPIRPLPPGSPKRMGHGNSFLSRHWALIRIRRFSIIV